MRRPRSAPVQRILDLMSRVDLVRRARGEGEEQGGSALSASGLDRGRFSLRWRRLGVLYVCGTLPLIAIRGLFVSDAREYLLAFVVTASGWYTTPALVVAWLAMRRSPPSQRLSWKLWLVTYLMVYSTGFAIYVGLSTDLRFGNRFGPVLTVAAALLATLARVDIVRRHSGRRAVSVDVLEGLMSVIVIGAPAALLWGESIVTADTAWFTVPAALSTVAMMSGFYWMVVLTVRLGPERTSREAVGIGLTLLGAVNGVAQIAQGLSDFTLPGGPLLASQAACMSMMLLVPLYSSDREPYGLSRLPPHAQVRGGEMPASLLLVGLPVLLIVTVAVNDRHEWAMTFSLGVVAVLLVLAGVRQLFAVRETRHLYAEVEEVSEERRELLSRVVEQTDEDRHRVVAQLHEQAIASYATFVSFIQATSRLRTGSGSSQSLSHVSERVRRDLAQQAESLRQLMVAVRPLGIESPGAVNLDAMIRAYLGTLYGDAPRPALQVSFDEDLELDWITETVVLRILQEALRNVWQHSHARHVDISMHAEGHTVELQVTDDGVGFDSTNDSQWSGLETMRSFAVFADGSLEVESAPGHGTVITARLGTREPADVPPLADPDQTGLGHLRLVSDT